MRYTDGLKINVGTMHGRYIEYLIPSEQYIQNTKWWQYPYCLSSWGVCHQRCSQFNPLAGSTAMKTIAINTQIVKQPLDFIYYKFVYTPLIPDWTAII